MNIPEQTTWLEKIPKQKTFRTLTKDISTDVVIVGGGLTGISIAYELSKEGKKVVVLEKADYTNSTTAYTTAFLTYMLDTSITELIRMYGKEETKLILESHRSAIDNIEQIITTEKIDCEFLRCSEYIYAKNKDEYDALEKEYTNAKELGFPLHVFKKPLPPFASYGYMEIPQQAKFHPVKYMLALREKAMKNGVKFFDNSEVKKINGDNPITVTTPEGTVTSQSVIIATYNPFKNPLAVFGKKGMYTSYVYEAKVKKDIIAEGLYLDLENPYHYVRVDKESSYSRIIVGGEDHRQEIPIPPEKNYTALLSYIQTFIPDTSFVLQRKWSGPILEPSDGIACIGQYTNDTHHLLATAFSGNGMTYATIASKLLTDIVCGKENALENIYNPRRLMGVEQLFTKGKDYGEEFLGGAVKNMFT